MKNKVKYNGLKEYQKETATTGKDTVDTNKKKKPSRPPTSDIGMDSNSTTDAVVSAINTPKKKQLIRPPIPEKLMDPKRNADLDKNAMNTSKNKQMSRPQTYEIVTDSKSNVNAAGAKEKKQPKRPTTSEMVMESIKMLNSTHGASLVAIKAFIGGFYDANTNLFSQHIERSLEIGVKEGKLEEVVEDGGGKRFKLKKAARPAIKTNPKIEEVAKKPLKRKSSNSDDNSTSAMKRNQPFLPQMVVESIKSLKMRGGAPVNAICQHMEEHYGVNVKQISPNLKKFLKEGVHKGILGKTVKSGIVERFIVKSETGIRKRKVISD